MMSEIVVAMEMERMGSGESTAMSKRRMTKAATHVAAAKSTTHVAAAESATHMATAKSTAMSTTTSAAMSAAAAAMAQRRHRRTGREDRRCGQRYHRLAHRDVSFCLLRRAPTLDWHSASGIALPFACRLMSPGAGPRWALGPEFSND
jgi:hypothetical protein